MKITDIEIHEITPPFHAWNSEALTRYQGSDFRCRTMFVLHTDNGLEGLGDGLGRRTPADDEWVERMVGTDPWDWIAHPDLPTRLAPAVYDVVAKYNAVPVYKLFGQRFAGRPVPNSGWMTRRVPVSAWTVSQTPAKMAEEVEFRGGDGPQVAQVPHEPLPQRGRPDRGHAGGRAPRLQGPLRHELRRHRRADSRRVPQAREIPGGRRYRGPAGQRGLRGLQAAPPPLANPDLLPPPAAAGPRGAVRARRRLHDGPQPHREVDTARGPVRGRERAVHDPEHRRQRHQGLRRSHGVRLPHGHAAPRDRDRPLGRGRGRARAEGRGRHRSSAGRSRGSASPSTATPSTA